MELRRLSPDQAKHGRWLAEVVMAAPAYSQLIAGRAPTLADAQEILTVSPPGIREADKFVLAILEGEDVLGCVDLIRGYPDAQTAYLGLLLLKERWQGRGIGNLVVARLMAMATGWGCTTMRLGVVETNSPALAFWSRQGFQAVDRTSLSGLTGDVLVMTRALPPP